MNGNSTEVSQSVSFKQIPNTENNPITDEESNIVAFDEINTENNCKLTGRKIFIKEHNIGYCRLYKPDKKGIPTIVVGPHWQYSCAAIFLHIVV